ncbi:tetratricopeptide repeat protein [bacterium]|nr:tetratricopeptide repeat protein [bacterium]
MKTKFTFIISLLIIILFTILLYHQVLNHDFVSWRDGDTVLTNNKIQDVSFRGILVILVPNLKDTYTPVTDWSYLLDYGIWGGFDSKGFHLSNLILFTLLACFFFWFLSIVFKKHYLFCMGVTLLFVSSPLNSEIVSCIASRGLILSGMFSIAVLITYMKSNSGSREAMKSISMLFSIFAILSNPIGIIVPIVIFFEEAYIKEVTIKKILRNLVPFFIVSGIAVLYYVLIGQFEISPVIFGGYVIKMLKNLFYPASLATVYPGVGSGLTSIIIGYLIFFILLFLLIKLKHFWGFFIGWFFIGYLPVLFSNGAYDYQMFYVGFGFVGVLGTVLYYLFGIDKEGKLKYVSIPIIVVLVLASSVFSYNRTRVWVDSFSLWETNYRNNTNKFSSVYYALAWEYQNNNTLKAIKYLNQVIEEDPGFLEGYRQLGKIYLNDGELKEARENYEKALTISPDDKEVLLNLGKIYVDMKELSLAETVLKRVIDIDPEESEAINRLAYIRYTAGNIDSAIVLWQRVIELDPGNANAYYNLGVHLERKGGILKAISYYKSAVKQDPYLYRGYSNLGVIYENLEEIDSALIYYKKAFNASNDIRFKRLLSDKIDELTSPESK